MIKKIHGFIQQGVGTAKNDMKEYEKKFHRL
jgi:hypothetical protein